LMNDSSYAYDISRNLIEMASVVFTDRSINNSSINEDMKISDEDIATIIK